MSFEAVLWATSDAPIANVNEFAVLVMLAEKADSDGCAAFPSRQTVANRTTVDPKTVQRTLAAMARRKLIGKGDQRAAQYLRADRRPTVYDLLIPYEWFPNIERINKERAERGKPPLSPLSRPPIGPPPAKARRSDRGKTRNRPEEAVNERGDSQSSRLQGRAEPSGRTVSPSRGDSQSQAGGLEDPRTSPLNLSSEPVRDAPSPRSGGDGRRPSDRSKGSREGGCAASGKDSPAPSKKQPKHTRQQLEQVAAVRRYFPQELAVPDIPAVSDAVLKALATGEPDSRTVEQLGSRIETRWHTHGWAMKVLEGEEIKSPVGVAINLVRAYGRDDKWGCANPRCEAGADVDTGAECNVCPERLDARKAARRVAEPAPQQAAPDDEAQEQPAQPAWDASSEPDYYPDDVRGDGEGEPPAWAVLDEEPVVPAQGGGLDEFAAARAQMRDGKSDRIRRANQYAR